MLVNLIGGKVFKYVLVVLAVAAVANILMLSLKRKFFPRGKRTVFSSSRKERLKVGTQFEQEIGALLEKEGWKISYEGINKGVNDGGIDLIGRRGGVTALVQCKYWKVSRVVHESHINQFRGSIEKYKNDHPNESSCGTFVTTASLSDEARRAAAIHGIEVIERFRF